MRTETMGKTMAIFMVMAMIATGIATLLPNVAAGDPQITGTVLSSVAPYNPIGGVTIDYTGASGAPTTTTDSQGKFTLYVNDGLKENFMLEFTKEGFGTTTRNFLSTSYIGDICATNTTTMVPDPTVSGIVKDMETKTPINNVEVNIIDKSTSWKVVKQIETGADGKFSCQVSGVTNIDIYYKINGYYSVIDENVDIITGADVGEVFLEKIVPTPTYKIWGIVFDEDTNDTLAGALVSISEGDDKWITALSNEEGKYEMYAYTGNFQIKCSMGGYFTKVDDTWVNIPSDKRRDMYLESTPQPEDRWVKGTISNSTGPLGDVTVNLFSNDGRYMKTNNTWWDGSYNISFYFPGTFTLEVKMGGYYTDASITTINGNSTHNIILNKIGKNFNLRGYVVDLENNDYIAGATVKIFDTNQTRLYTNSTITDKNGYYVFNVSTGSIFAVLVDALGYQSKLVPIDAITKNKYLEVGLQKSGSDEIETTYTFLDWNTIMASRNSIITVDNVSVRLDADRMFGMGNLSLTNNNRDLNQNEIDDWAEYLRNKGIEKRDTKEFLTLNNTFYNLNTTSYNVKIENALGPVLNYSTIYINSTYNYTIAKALENVNSDIFTLELNATYDTEYLDNIYNIILPTTPSKFEMTRNITTTSDVEVTGYFNPITIDTMISTKSRENVTMTLQRSMNGTALAKILSGVNYVLNSTYGNYTAIVPMGPISDVDTNITFSAADSTDDIGDITKANFTWDFDDGIMGYGMEVEHDFLTTDGELIVKLLITETGGNMTWDNITVFVDSQNPVAGISAITTDSANISFLANNLTVNEDLPVMFSGVKFSDTEGMGTQTIAGTSSMDAIVSGDGGKGIIDKWYWSWGEEDVFNETITKEGGNNISHAYSKPGTYSLEMITTDAVGRESATATWTVKVLDITAPATDFSIKNIDGAVVSEVTENKSFTYNATLTTDNYDEVGNLTFEWSFNIAGTISNFTGMSINYTFTKAGDYNVTLKATDKAGNYYNMTKLIHINLDERPNILMNVGTMVFSQNPGTAGKAMTISVNITNDGKTNATNIQTKFYIRNADGNDTEIGTATTSFLGIGETTSAEISWIPGKKGEFSIWANATCAGEHSSQWWDNKIDDFGVQKVSINEAAWVLPAIVVGIIVVIIVVFLGMKYFMKSGTEEEASGDKRKKR
ncbi:MAG: PKD domain-containing protein [Thermoplasmata archaeon]|nr:PKD domain-containing protein [Thermoplasmata archaeon]